MPQKKGCIAWNKGKKLSDEHRKNLSISHIGQKAWNKGTAKPKIKKGPSRYWLGKKRSKEDRIKMSLGKKGKTYPKMSDWKIGRKLSKTTKKRMSKSAIKHMKSVGRTYLTPNIGKIEKNIIDSFEDNIGFKIFRQYQISKYYVDGFCSELNLVIEINEEYHHKNKKDYDIIREKRIKEILGCSFLNINIPKEVMSL